MKETGDEGDRESSIAMMMNLIAGDGGSNSPSFFV